MTFWPATANRHPRLSGAQYRCSQEGKASTGLERSRLFTQHRPDAHCAGAGWEIQFLAIELTHDAENMFLGVPIYIHWTSGAAKCSVKRCTVACYAAPSGVRARAGCQVDGQRNRAIFAASNMPAPITMMLNRSYIGILNILLFL